MTESLKKIIRLLFLIGIIFTIPAITRQFMTFETMIWYHKLPLSPLTPPDYWFSIVWSVLYLCMAISAFLVWDKVSPRYFVLQLAFNGMWTFVFFYLRQPFTALVVLSLLMIFLSKCIRPFYQASKTAGLLLVPLWLWSAFALYLNAYIVIMR